MIPFVIIILLAILVGSLLGFAAFFATQRIDALLNNFPLDNLTSRLFQLELRLTQLQKTLAELTPPAKPPADSSATPSAPATPLPRTEAPKPQAVAPTAPPAATAPATPPVRSREFSPQPHPSLAPKFPPPPGPDDLEARIGGRWFNRIGIIALLFAVSYFLKLAFDNNWIGPAGRVTIGMILGALMLPWSEWLLRRDYSYFSEGIAGLGEATLFVSVFAGCQYYTLYTRGTGFAFLVVVTLVMAFLALRRDSERIALLSLLGGLLTPALMSTGQNQQVALFSYLLLLGAAALVVSWRRNWLSLLPLVFIGTHLYFWQWYDAFYTRPLFLGRTLLFAGLFFLLYAVIPVLRAFQDNELRPVDLLLVFGNALVYSVSLYTFLWPVDRGPLTIFYLLLAAAHAAVAFILPANASDRAGLPRMIYIGLAVTFFSIAIPVYFDGNTITVAFAVEGAALVWAGCRYFPTLLRPAGYALLITSAFRLLALPPHAGAFLWNERFATYVLLVACFGFSLWSVMAGSDSERENPRSEIAALVLATNFFTLLALSLEFWDYFGSVSRHGDHLAQHLSLSILWTAYAGLLLALGILRRSSFLRWQALFLLGGVVLKVFLLDLSFLDRSYRILSFFMLGSALLIVSFFYQRKLARSRSSS